MAYALAIQYFSGKMTQIARFSGLKQLLLTNPIDKSSTVILVYFGYLFGFQFQLKNSIMQNKYL